MKFSLSSMWVDSFSLTPTTEPNETGEEFTMNVDSAVDFNSVNKTEFRFSISIKLHKNERFIFKACQMAVVKFGKEMSEEEAKETVSTVDAAQYLYPYLRAFVISTLRVAGYNNINLPVVIFQ
ncbi:TPA: protein-export chaperone SecB [Citrobacter koseri]|nr:protein-export chaperone SecB [Citrobacter koseri]